MLIFVFCIDHEYVSFAKSCRLIFANRSFWKKCFIVSLIKLIFMCHLFRPRLNSIYDKSVDSITFIFLHGKLINKNKVEHNE